MNFGSRNQIQGDRYHFQGVGEHQQLENLIEDKAGVRCFVEVQGGSLKIRTKSYTDYVLARSVIKGRTSLVILWDKDL